MIFFSGKLGRMSVPTYTPSQIKKYFLGIALVVLSAASFAQSCNRKDPDMGDYVHPWEFCDDDLTRKTVPTFGEHPAETSTGLKPRLPTRF